MKSYATMTELKARLAISDSTDDVMLDNALAAASRWIDLYCGRRFDYTTETRYYTAEEGDLLRVDDLVSVSSLTTDEDEDRTYETTWTTNDYDLMPANAALENRPYTTLEVSPIGSYAFPTGAKGVKLVGVFGWPAVPGPVKEATLLLAAGLFKRKDAIFGVLGTVDTGMVRIAGLDAQVQQMLMPYRKVGVGAI
ncbi:MAG: hypothetical protein BWY10_02526 [Chloroflexi bacterium ADurb.Bin180]|nr:MAG: hypothetical protein BWY10_02526 [Chloroflexi bacterium ADurb.Bin180]